MSAAERTQLCKFMKRCVAVETDVRDVLEIDGLLSMLDEDYAASRERMINIGKALKSGHVDIPAGEVRGLWYTNVFNQATHSWTRDWRISLAPVSAWHGMNMNPQSE